MISKEGISSKVEKEISDTINQCCDKIYAELIEQITNQGVLKYFKPYSKMN
jgi:hypothetical protein